MNLLSGIEIWCPLSVLERVRIIEVFLKKIYVGTLETVRNREVDDPYQRGVRTERFDCINNLFFSFTMALFFFTEDKEYYKL